MMGKGKFFSDDEHCNMDNAGKNFMASLHAGLGLVSAPWIYVMTRSYMISKREEVMFLENSAKSALVCEP